MQFFFFFFFFFNGNWFHYDVLDHLDNFTFQPDICKINKMHYMSVQSMINTSFSKQSILDPFSFMKNKCLWN